MQIKKYIHYLLLLTFSTLTYLTQAQNQAKMVLPIGHTSYVISGQFNASGSQIVSASYDNTAKIWDAEAGELRHTLQGHTDWVRSAHYNASGSQIVTASDDNTAKIWDAQTGELLHTLQGHTSDVYSAHYNASGSQIVTASDDETARIWDAQTGELLHTLRGHTYDVYSAAYNASGSQIVTASWDSTAKIWDASTGELLHTLQGHTRNVWSAVYNAIGSQIVTASNDKTARIWDAETGELLHTLQGHTGSVRSAQYNASGSQIVTASDDETARIWDAQTGELLHTLRGHTYDVYSAAYNASGSQIVTASWDSTAKIWDASTGELLHTLQGHTDWLESAQYNGSGSQIVTASWDNTAKIWDASTGELLHTLQGHTSSVESAQYNASGNQIVTASFDKTARIWDASTGEQLHTLQGHTRGVKSAQYNASGSQIVTASDDKTSKIWDASTGELLHTLQGHTDGVESAQYNASGSQIVTASDDNTARIWDAETGELLHTLQGHTRRVFSAQYNASGSQIVTASDDKTSKIWDASTGELLHTLQGHTLGVESAQYNGSGSQIVTASWDNTAKIWDASTGELLHTLQGHTSSVNSAEYNPTGNQIVTASRDGTAKIWDALTGELLHILKGHTYWVNSAHYNASGSQIVTASWDETSKIWDASTGELLYALKGHFSGVESARDDPSGNHIITTGADKTIIWDAKIGKQLYTRLQLNDGDWLAYDEHYRFDGSPGGIDQLYLVCGLEVIDLNQVKDSLYVPGLVSQIMAGNKEIMLHDKPVAKLEDLNICELTPLVEPIEGTNGKLLRYRIIPRKGGLGNVELYINNNLTYTYTQSQLQKEAKTKNYILEVNTDTLQQYFTGDKGSKNPIAIKPLIQGGGIYGRGEGFTIVKTVDRKIPKFIGVFVGVNDYNNPAKDQDNPSYYTDLSYAEADAEDLANAVEVSARSLFEDSVLIYRVTQQSNKAPTKQELEKVFDDISKKAKSEDILYIFFAGHGGVPKTQANPNNEVRFMLQKAQKQNPMTTSFGLSDIRQWTNAQRMKAQKRVLVFDACQSGKIIQEMTNNYGGNHYASRGIQDQGWRKKQLDKLKDQTGMMILAASAEDQVSYEDPQLKHGVMTYHLLEQMKQMPQDTTLIIKDWFESSTQGVESFIDRKYTRSTDDPDKPVQSPEMFGSGKFAIGVVNNQVKESIELAKVKLTIGKIDFNFRIKPGREKETVHQWIYEYLQQNIDPKKMEIAVGEDAAYVYTIDGSIFWGDEYVSYDIIKQGKVIKKEIELEGFNSKNPQQTAEAIAESIIKEIQNID